MNSINTHENLNVIRLFEQDCNNIYCLSKGCTFNFTPEIY